MGWKNRDLNSSMVLDFAIFIAGFLTGMLAFGVIRVSSDITTLSVIIFALGFTIGIIVFGFAIIMLKRRNQPSPQKFQAQKNSPLAAILQSIYEEHVRLRI
jgi:uncharacterized membrane protein YciS (DUF1049 family)